MKSLVRIVPLSLVALAGCGDGDDPASRVEGRAYSIQFRGAVGDAPFACGSFDGLGTSAATAAITDFRFYAHDFRLVAEDGTEVPLVLENDGIWQRNGVALLDFEDASGPCDSGTTGTRDVVRGVAPEGDWKGLRFVLGVPFEQNHQDASLAHPPLDLTSMFWTWNGGYKFLRVDAVTPANPAGFRIHLGSTGCQGEFDAITGCEQPNRASIELADFDPDGSVIVADVARLVATANLDENTAGTAPGCMAAPDDPECGPIFEALGLAAGSSQRFFRVE